MNEPDPDQARELSCSECREMLSGYCDRELEAPEQAAVEGHLRTCEKCGKESTEIRGLKQIVQHWRGIEGSGEWRRSLVERFVRESRTMPAGPLAEAAESIRETAQDVSPELKNKLPPVLILTASALLAVVAYILVRALMGA